MNRTSWLNRLCCTGLVAGMLMLTGIGPAFADRSDRDYRGDHKGRDTHRDYRGDHKGRDTHQDYQGDRRDRGGRRDHRVGVDQGGRFAPRDHRYKESRVIYRDRHYGSPGHHVRRYRDVVIVRPYGHWYPGYAHIYHDSDAYKWLAFTAITLKILDNLNEQQQREHEAAQVAATTAPIGESIVWREGDASGAVTATREGTSTSGRYCREFLQEVTIGGRAEEAYGTACRQPDGTWEVISTD